MGTVELDRGDVQAAITYFEASLGRFTELNDQWGMALVLGNLAQALRTTTEHARAERIARQSVEAFEALGDEQGTARSLTTLALILGRNGQPGEGLTLHARGRPSHASRRPRGRGALSGKYRLVPGQTGRPGRGRLAPRAG